MYALNVYRYDRDWIQSCLYFVKSYYSLRLLHALFYIRILPRYRSMNKPTQIAVILLNLEKFSLTHI